MRPVWNALLETSWRCVMKPCPNCESDQTYVADCCGYVICRKCGMTGPVAPVGNDEEAEKLWDGLPRYFDYQMQIAQGVIRFLNQTLQQVYNELHFGPAGDGMWRLRAMRLIKAALDGAHD